MNTRYSRATLVTALVAVLGLASAGVASAQTTEVWLAAKEFSKALPGGVTVPMWGFADCGGDFTGCATAAPDAPGARITVAAGDSLTIHLQNELQVPVSLVVPGQSGAGDPVIQGGRVRSFTHETAPGTTADYAFSSVRAGTYLYQSGTRPSIQVPMGLYGALVVEDAAYPGVAWDVEALLLYSEIDVVQNEAVQAAAPDSTAYPSAVDYSPQYFLVNGTPYTDWTKPWLTVGDGLVDRTLLLRLLNAGLRSHAAAAVGLELTAQAEDGHVRPRPQAYSSTLLPAGKSLDVTAFLPAGNHTYPIYDRMLELTNANEPSGGLLAYLATGSGTPSLDPPVATDDQYTLDEDTVLSVNAIDGVLANDIASTGANVVSGPSHGELILGSDGSFTYTPDLDFFGEDAFSYSADGGEGAWATLTVLPVNDPPMANPDGLYTNSVGTSISIEAPGVLGNDVDVDGDALTASLVGTPDGVTLGSDGSFSYTGAGTGLISFGYEVTDGVATAAGTVSLDVRPTNGPTLTVQGPAGPVAEYHWVLEEDTTFEPVLPPGVNPEDNTLGLNFHRSYMRVVAQGCVGAACPAQAPLEDAVLDDTKRHYVSVLPLDAGTDTGHTLGAAQVPAGATSVTVHVNQAPVPLAQISVLVFQDDHPTNGAPDGNEAGLGGFQILLEDAGGRYGASAGAMMQDALGNPLRNSKDCGPGAPTPPQSVILTCPDGTALIQNLAPGKYGLTAVPPAGAGSLWKQTSTIEGKRIIDAWVAAGEPPYFQEFGPPGYHVFIGFVSPDLVGTPTGPNAVSGRVTNLHMSRPPDQRLWDSESRDALAHTTAWVGLNSEGGIGRTIAVAPADAEGYFSLSGVPDGTYQLVVWDDYLDQIIAFRNVTVTGGTGGNLGNVPVFQWFARLENHVFLDGNENGVREGGEIGLLEQNVNLRWRDGTLYQGAPTDTEGYVPFDETFPFFSWLVAEVDFARHKATGVTVTPDGGGDSSATGGVLVPQAGSPRTEVGPVLTQAFQGFLGQTSVLEWGKKPYVKGENGGISGIVYYATTRAENDPRLAAAEPWEPGIPRVTVRLYREITRADGSTGLVFVAETRTDSWDDTLPSGCPGADASDPVTPDDKCYDGLRNFNQVRPGVFDGGYAFSDIPAGRYVVEVIPPAGYEIVKEEDKNVDFGDFFSSATLVLPNMALVEIVPNAALLAAVGEPQPGLAQPACVGADHVVPDTLSLFPGQIDAPFAAASRPLCNRKSVILNDRANGVADFFLFTKAPIAAHTTGMILDDTAQELNPASVQFGEKWAPPFVPVAFYDYTGREVTRVYSDQFGRFNALLPSTFSMNLPMFSGASPSMLTSCMNDPGPLPGETTPDPQYNSAYGTFCYTFQYMPGATTYLDTPVLPTAAFAAGYPAADCAFPDGTPRIRRVDGTGTGPWVSGAGLTLTISSLGPTEVPNPAYEGPGSGAAKTVSRDYGFGGTTGSVTLGGIPLTVGTWTDGQITATVPSGATTGQLLVTRGDNNKHTITSITVHVGGATPRRVAAGGSIQAAIDAAAPGELIIVEPGAYDELVIMWKPVRLQGSGPGATLLNAAKRPASKLAQWRARLEGILASGDVDLLPGQEQGAGGIEPLTLNTEQGAGITVLGPRDILGASHPNAFSSHLSRIDGFTITGGDSAGAIFVNGWAHDLQISNNRVFGNSGLLHGGIRVGMPYLQELTGTGPFAFNKRIRVHHNAITQNGALGGAGGGLSLCTGTDEYLVSENWICGNFTLGDGAGLAHLGLSAGGAIRNNTVVFNQSFDQGLTRHGGGLLIAGEPPVGTGVTLGAGSVTVDANLIQGNQAGAGHGGGVRTQYVNGMDVVLSPRRPADWFTVTLTNNMIVDNVAGWAGGGVSLMDTARALIVNNTISHNDSTSTVGAAFVDPNFSLDQPAGIVSEVHSAALAAAFGGGGATAPYRQFSNPTLDNNILWQNRSFHYEVTVDGGRLVPDLAPATPGACAPGATHWDLGVLGTTTFSLSPRYSILTNATGNPDANGNRPGPPQFAGEYCNGARSSLLLPEVTNLQAAPALDEGGNFIDVRYGPVSLTGDYHIQAGSPAVDNGTGSGAPSTDYDLDSRVSPVDIGADEIAGGAPPSGGYCSANSTNAGASCQSNSDCPPNTGPNRGTCVLP